MALPQAAQAKKDALEQDPTKPVPTAVKNLPKPDETTPVSPAKEGGDEGEQNVSLSRKEYSELRAAADKSKAAAGRAEALENDLQVMRQRLTELETPAKDKQEPTPSKENWNIERPSYTEQETADYGESKGFIVKVVHEVLAGILPTYLKEINTQIKATKETAQQASETASNSRANAFTHQVRARVPDFDACVENSYWAAFVQAVEPTSGNTFADLIRGNLAKENLQGMVNIFSEFKRRYRIGEQQASGYESAIPSSTALPTQQEPKNKVLKFSERKAAHDKYLRKEITFDEYQKTKLKFDEADKEGRINYDA